MKVRAVLALRAEHRLDVLLEAAGVARSTFFYHQARLRGPDPHTELKAVIGEIFARSHGRYGHRRIHHVLAGAGRRVAKKTVLTLMRTLGLVCRVRRKKRYTSYQGRVGLIAANLLDRDFTATAPNRKWVTDVTEFRVGDRKLYLSPVMDLFDRQIIAYSIGPSPNLELTNSSLRAALATLGDGQTPLVHSDQGFQYQHSSWRRLLADAGATQSMSRKANCYDNAVMENFFGHLKEELFHHTRYLDTDALTTALDEYIHWYNTERISTKLEGLSPVQYRTQALTA
ncbi:putative transposase [Rhodococcus sp. LBL1]|uniref:Transposase n=1 Tax=Prescottella agglutinans TaxID=1644129 RepID=A0ABT6MLB1_9NOCA|nr:IS3 family transposase [Prescottella agglutinans]MDH6285105.1 putative transposase [Prescottella agglutinans]MDH6681097.1 putative transposase [Rhodococcus sp. LBL1]MDH6686377.1 putative transposase [Rhodococcus sp. LBL2]